MNHNTRFVRFWLLDDAIINMYQGVASSYLQTWLSRVVSSDKTRLLSVFDQQQSSGILYNLYADKLLGTNIFPASIYELREQPLLFLSLQNGADEYNAETNWYSSHASASCS